MYDDDDDDDDDFKCHSRSLKMAPFDRSDMSSCWRFVVGLIMALSLSFSR